RKRNGIGKDGNADGAGDGRPGRTESGGIEEAELLESGGGNEGDRRNRADVVAANVLFAAHVKPIVGRNFEAAVSGDVGGTGMEAKDIAMLVHLLIFLPVEDVGDGVDVTAERAAGERKLVQVALAGSGIHGVVDGVVADARRERARQDAVEGAR